MGIKNKLESLMKQAGLNTLQLSKKAGISSSTLYAILKRDSDNISYQTAKKLAVALGCRESDLLNFSEDTLYHESLIQEIAKINNQIKELQKDCYEDIITDKDGTEYIRKTSVNDTEIDYLEHKRDELDLELSTLLGNNAIAFKAGKYAEILNPYIKLNEKGKLEAVKRIIELTYVPEYIEKN